MEGSIGGRAPESLGLTVTFEKFCRSYPFQYYIPQRSDDLRRHDPSEHPDQNDDREHEVAKPKLYFQHLTISTFDLDL
jgi:hypothetical protein